MLLQQPSILHDWIEMRKSLAEAKGFLIVRLGL